MGRVTACEGGSGGKSGNGDGDGGWEHNGGEALHSAAEAWDAEKVKRKCARTSAEQLLKYLTLSPRQAT